MQADAEAIELQARAERGEKPPSFGRDAHSGLRQDPPGRTEA